MTEIVNRVAKAMMDRFQLIAGPQLKADSVYWQEMAKFAIAAMREPTEAMQIAGQVDPSPVSTDAVWRAMIDAALARS